ncbi:MAG: NAD-dependent epimerase/dehydratase family protein [Candidatus Sulfotelmatobacter sp.]
MATFLVTGDAGFIGSHLVESVLAAGNTVVCIDDLSTGSLDNLAAFAKHPAPRIIEGRCVILSDRAGVESTWAVCSATVS